MLITGLHTVCDIYCITCNCVLGWKYEVRRALGCTAALPGAHVLRRLARRGWFCSYPALRPAHAHAACCCAPAPRVLTGVEPHCGAAH